VEEGPHEVVGDFAAASLPVVEDIAGVTEAAVAGDIPLTSVENGRIFVLDKLGLSRICAKVYLDVFGGFISSILGYPTAV
jgi:hypothetical protein